MQDAVGHAVAHVAVVKDADHCAAGTLGGDDQLDDDIAIRRVERHGGLIKQKRRPGASEAAREIDPLLARMTDRTRRKTCRVRW